MSDAPILLTETPAPGVRLLRLNRPAKRNALTVPLVVALADALDAADADAGIGAIVVTGDLKAFCAGSDIAEQNAHGTGHVFSPVRLAAWDRIGVRRKPVIAAVDGYAMGGGLELMLLFDFAICGSGAVFGMPEILLGVFPGDGGTQRLPRRIGTAPALRMILTGERIDAARAFALGLVTEVVPAGETVDRAVAVAATIAGHSALALAMARKSVLEGGALPLDAGLALERACLEEVFRGEDWKAGMKAFVERK